jgi:hypothetical protein
MCPLPFLLEETHVGSPDPFLPATVSGPQICVQVPTGTFQVVPTSRENVIHKVGPKRAKLLRTRKPLFRALSPSGPGLEGTAMSLPVHQPVHLPGCLSQVLPRPLN